MGSVKSSSYVLLILIARRVGRVGKTSRLTLRGIFPSIEKKTLWLDRDRMRPDSQPRYPQQDSECNQ